MPKRKRSGNGGNRKRRRYSRRRRPCRRPKPFRGSIRQFPCSIITKLPYHETIEFSGTSGYSAATYRSNSLYDPRVGAAGAQPYGYDQLHQSGQMYNRYKVFAVKVEATFVNMGTEPVIVSLGHIDDSTVEVTNSDVLENKQYKKKWLTNQNGSRTITTLKMYGTLKSLFGKSILNDEDYGAVWNTDPNLQAYIHIRVQNMDNSVTAIDTVCSMKITYYAKFFDLNDFNGS